MLKYIDRFGLGVLGRPPGAGEMKRMITAENTMKAYQSRSRADNWAKWADDYPDLARLLEIGMRANDGRE